MVKSSVRPADDEIENTVNSYANILFKLCFTILCNRSDAEDAVSDTFFKYITKAPAFCDEEHRKAWLLKVAANVCKDIRRFSARHNHANLDDLQEIGAASSDKSIIEDLMQLPVKYKTVVHLHYIEGYRTKEIAEMLSISPSAVRKRLQYGRDLLRLEYRKDGVL